MRHISTERLVFGNVAKLIKISLRKEMKKKKIHIFMSILTAYSHKIKIRTIN